MILKNESTILSPYEVLHGYPMPLHIDWTNALTDTELAEEPVKELISRTEAQDWLKTITT